MTEPKISSAEAQAEIDKKTFPRVTKDSIAAQIASAEYVNRGTLTICIITMQNGFRQLGQSACASPENYDQNIGERLAFEDAFRGLWALEGYLLCEIMNGERA